jgi:tetratricopeptide (TPR) repeat protein
MPLIGLLIMAGWGIAELLRYPTSYKHVITSLVTVMSVGIVLCVGVASWIQTRYWRDSMVFYGRQIELVPNNPYFNTNMALVYARSGKYEQAIQYADRALAIWPRVYEAHLVLEEVYSDKDNPDLARYHREKANEIRLAALDEHKHAIASHLLLGKRQATKDKMDVVK